MLQIGIVADYQEDLPSHDATDAAIKHVARALNINYSTEWIPTDTLEHDAERSLRFSRGILIAPGSPYLSMQGALNAIRIARESGRPLLGTCGGFQHIVLEYARNVLGLADAQHAEYESAEPRSAAPSVSRPNVIRSLPCSLAGKTLRVDLAPNSQALRIYGRSQIEETYHCSYGLDPAHREQLEAAGLRVSGVEAGVAASNSEASQSEASQSEALTESVGEARIVELPTHPFFIGTLFIPQMRSTPERPHPLIEAFINAIVASKVPVDERPTFDDQVGMDE